MLSVRCSGDAVQAVAGARSIWFCAGGFEILRTDDCVQTETSGCFVLRMTDGEVVL